MIEPRDAIKNLQDYKPPIDARIDKYRYDFNENVLGASPKAIEALRTIDPVKISTYPEYENYYLRIANYFDLSPKQIMLSNGTDEAIKLILETYMEAGDEMLLPVPTFAMFKFYAQRIGIDINEVLYNKDLTFPTSQVIDAITSTTRMVVLVNPNNPTGTPISQQDIVIIVEKARHCLVLIDEAYYDFASSNSQELIDRYDNVVILRTFSKSIGLAGLRIGMAISNPEIIAVLQKSSSPYNVSAIACHMAAAAVEDPEYSKNYVEKVLASRAKVSETLQNWGFKVYPSQSNFLLVDFGYMASWIIRHLRSKRILVRDRSSYPLLDNCVRVTLGDSEDTKRLLGAIDEARKIPPIIFDIDGVLVDVSQSYREAIALTVEKFTSEKPDKEQIQALKNEGGFNNDWKLSQELIRRSNIDIVLDDVIQEFQKFYLGNGDTTGLIQEEFWILEIDQLEQIHNSNPVFILTGRPRNEAKIALETAGASEYFDAIIAMEDVPEGRGKPDPWGLNSLLDNFVNIENAIYFGDTVDDMTAAKTAGIRPIGILAPGHDDTTVQALTSAGAEKVITIDKIQEEI